MPSKHTVVVSLDEETEKILDEVGGNRSEWIREAIRQRVAPAGDAELLQALCDARQRRIETLRRAIDRLLYCMNEFEDNRMLTENTRQALSMAREA